MAFVDTLQVIEATTVGAACTFKPSLPKRRKEGEEDEEDEDEEEGDADRKAVEEFMGRYSEVGPVTASVTVTATAAVASPLIHTYQRTPLTTPTNPL
jgi:hypothetical protein